MTRTTLVALLSLVGAAGCEPGVIDWGHDYVHSGVSVSSTGGTGTGGSTASATGGTGGATGGSTGSAGGNVCMPGSTAPCYDGPPGTEGVGICKAGSKTCNPDGMTYGPCVGVVTPQQEDCTKPQDEDCDGFAPECNGDVLWVKSFGDANDQFARSIAVDASGNLLVTGNFSGMMSLGGGPLTSTAGSKDLFIAKLDPKGNHLWSKRFGDGGYQEGWSIAVDASGNVLVTGAFTTTMDLGGGPLTSAGGTDLFVAKFDSSGTHLWSKRFGDANNQQGRSIAVDASGNVLVTGFFGGTMNLGGSPLTSTLGSSDLFVAKFDPSGTHLWSKRFGDGNEQQGEAVAVDASGNVVITGNFSGTMDFGGGPLTTTPGSLDLFVAKFDANGAHLWSKRFGDASYQGARAVTTVDILGNVLVTGYFSGTMDLGGGPLTSAPGTDLFVAKFDPSGTHVWSKGFGDAGLQQGEGIAVDASGNVLVTGSFEKTMDLGGGPLTSTAGSQDLFVAKFDPNGIHLWSKRFGDASDQVGQGVAVDTSDHVLITGFFGGSMDFGFGVITSTGASDIFVAKFTP